MYVSISRGRGVKGGRLGHLWLWPILVICLSGCGGPAPTAVTSGGVKNDPSFSQDVQKIFNLNGCTVSGCHDVTTAQQGLILTTGQAYGHLVNVPSTEVPSKNRVSPHDVSGSYLIDKIEGTQSVGVRMPAGRTPLSNDDIQMIKNWISMGARNN